MYCAIVLQESHSFRVIVCRSYRTSRISGYGTDILQSVQNFGVCLWPRRIKLAVVPSGYKSCCARTPGVEATGIQNLRKFRVRAWKSNRTSKSSGYGDECLTERTYIRFCRAMTGVNTQGTAVRTLPPNTTLKRLNQRATGIESDVQVNSWYMPCYRHQPISYKKHVSYVAPRTTLMSTYLSFWTQQLPVTRDVPWRGCGNAPFYEWVFKMPHFVQNKRGQCIYIFIIISGGKPTTRTYLESRNKLFCVLGVAPEICMDATTLELLLRLSTYLQKG